MNVWLCELNSHAFFLLLDPFSFISCISIFLLLDPFSSRSVCRFLVSEQNGFFVSEQNGFFVACSINIMVLFANWPCPFVYAKVCSVSSTIKDATGGPLI